jgi:hypothetical protein
VRGDPAGKKGKGGGGGENACEDEARPNDDCDVRGGGGRVIHERGGEPGSPGADVEGVSPFGPGADATRSEPVRPPCG